MADPPAPPPPGSPVPFFGRERVPLVTAGEAAAFDAWSMAPCPGGPGVRPGVLMESAGRTAAAALQAHVPHGPVLVLAGPGGNGGDGIVLARTLHQAGRHVTLRFVSRREDPDPLLHGHPLPVLRGPTPEAGELEGASVIVDAILGIGIRGGIRPPLDELVADLEAVRQAPSGPVVVSLDLPTGLDADTGTVHGPAVSADLTLAFGAAKLGSLLGEGRRRTGRLVVLDIGFPPWPDRAATGLLITPGWAARRRPLRGTGAHKKSAGRLLLLAGSPGMAGAAVLAARGALRSGVGYLQVVAGPQTRSILQNAVPEALVVAPEEAPELLGDVDCLAAGPGLGTDPGAEGPSLLAALLGSGELPPSILLDADALTLLAAGHLPLPGGGGKTPSGERGPGGGRQLLLTPHPGEMARLEARWPPGDGPPMDDGEPAAPPPLGRARSMALRTGAACLLKGSPTVVAESAARYPVLVAPTSSSTLARAGMGDVLTGVAAGLMAQGLAAGDAAGLALHLTGRAAELSGLGHLLLPTDVVEHLPQAWREDGHGESSLSGPFLLYDRAASP